MRRKMGTWGLILAMAATLVFPGRACAHSTTGVQIALDRAANYLLAQEKEQDKSLSPWSYVALATAGKNLGGARVEQSCEQQFSALTRATSPPPATADYCLLVFTLIAGGRNPYSYQGHNLVQKIQAVQLPNGKFADNIDGSGQGENGEQILANAHVWAVLALRAARAEIPDEPKAKQWLSDQQLANGGFYWCVGEKDADVDSTGMALMALGALGERKDSPVVQKAVAYLQSVQENDGGFISWGVANPESCSMVIQGLLAVGIDPTGEKMSRAAGNPVTAMLGFQLTDGSFAHAKGTGANEMATQQALLALAGVSSGKTLPDRLREKEGQDKPASDAMATGIKEIRFPVRVKEYVVATGEQRKTVQTDVAPFIENGRTYVPVRHLALALEVSEEGISWSELTQTVTLTNNGTTVTLVNGGNVLYINGVPQPPMEVTPLIRDKRIYLPARYVAEAFGYQVSWENLSQTVVITKKINCMLMSGRPGASERAGQFQTDEK